MPLYQIILKCDPFNQIPKSLEEETSRLVSWGDATGTRTYKSSPGFTRPIHLYPRTHNYCKAFSLLD